MKKLMALLLAVVMVFSLAACTGNQPQPSQQSGPDLAGTYDIKVWAPEKAQELTKKQVEAFNTSNEFGIKFNATFEEVGEGDAAGKVTQDLLAAGDIFFFPQDQLARLVQANALSALADADAKAVAEANDGGVVAAAKSADKMYAYPLTSDNGYFMYYDKSVISEDIVDSLEDLIKACEDNKKYFSMQLDDNAWYLAGFFFGTGCTSEWAKNEDGTWTIVKDDWNSDNGLIAMKGAKKLLDSDFYNNSSSGSAFDSNSAVVVSGTWDYDTVKGILGDNLGVTDLPSFTVDGKEYHIGSFNGCKLLGVRSQTESKRNAALHKLAQYLTGEACQLERFNELSWGPSNLADQKSDAVLANPGLAALLKQSAYSRPQGQYNDDWWSTAGLVGKETGEATDDAGIKAALAKYEAAIKEIAGREAVDPAIANAFTVIGVGGDWETDHTMTEAGGVWTSDEAFDFEADNEFKVRKGRAWEESYGAADGSNYKVAEAGKYYVVFNSADGTIELKKAE
ncbi:MAG: extracellular solute-binding protein [Lachnospiraceae bacterium]|nr:extracellular solute-binding protein [Lachnospiraceae bacterium]